MSWWALLLNDWLLLIVGVIFGWCFRNAMTSATKQLDEPGQFEHDWLPKP